MVAGAQTVSQAVTHSGTELDEGEEAAAALQSKIISVTVRCTMKWPCTCCVPYEYSRFPFFVAAWDVSPGGTSAHKQQKFHTDDVKSVQNLVRSSDWST